MIIFMLMNILNRVFLHQKPHIFSYRNLYFNSSQGSGEQKASKSKLTPLQQKALVGYYAMLRIATFSQQNFLQSSYSLREYLINKDHFFNFVSKQSKADLRDVIDDECLDEVLDGFRIGKGAKYARYVFSQERFAKAQSPRKDDKKFQLNSSQSSNSISLEHKSQQQEDIKVFPREREESAFQAHQQIDQEEQDKDEIPKKQVKQQEYPRSKSPFGNIVLNPLSYTGKIIDQILFCNTLIVCGQKGAGKSFAYLIYTYCTDFIFQLRRSQQYQQKSQEEMFKYVNKSLFENVPRLSYFPLKKKNTFSQIAKVLQYQNQHVKPILLPEKQKLELYYSQQKIKREIFERYLEEITTLDENKNIISGCIIDQANHYYQQIRTYLKNSQNYRGMTILETERVLMKQKAFLKSKWISEVIQSVYSYFTPTILNSSQNIQKKYLEQVNEKYQLNFFDLLHHETELVYPISYKKYLQTQAGQVELYGVFWFQIETKLNYHNQSEETIKKLRKIFNNTFALPGSNSSKKNSLSFWKKDVRFYNIRKVIRNLSLTQLKKYFEQNTIKMLRKRIENNRQQTFGKHFSKFFNKGLEKDNILRHRFLSLLNIYVGRILKNRPTQTQQKTEFIIENPHQFGQEFFIELRQSLDLQAYSIKGVDGKESVKCIFHYTPQFVRDLTEKNMEVLIKKYKSFIVQLAGNMDIDSSCVGQIYQGLLNFFVYPAEVALKMVQYDRGGRNSELTFDIVDTQPILSQTKSNKQKQIKKPSIQQSLQPVLISAEKHPQCYVAGIPTNRSHFFFDFAIAKYSSKDASTKKLQLWLIDYTVGELSKKASQKYKVLSQFIGKFDTFCPGYDVKVNFYLASPNELSEEYANFMRVKSKQGQKNNLFTILGQFKDKKEALQKKFQFKIMGVPKLVQFLNFKQQYIYPVNKNTAFEYIAQAQLFFDTFVKLSTKKAVKK